MKKLVALEKIHGLFSKITYAERHDELEFIHDHDDEIGFYRNLRTNEPFHTRKERVGEIEQANILFFVETEKKDSKPSSKKKDTGDINQAKLFI
jgi:hypothetical protein